jgi:flagellar basal body-associated protein FliL
METKTLIMVILFTVLALFALTALFIWLGSKLEDQFAKQRDKARKLDQPKPDIHEEIQNTLAERQRILDNIKTRKENKEYFKTMMDQQ